AILQEPSPARNVLHSRREFLAPCVRISATLCAAFQEASALAQEIGVGLIGFGLAGRSFHAPVIRAVPGLRLAAILQRSGSEAAEAYPDVRIVRSLDDMLAMP